MKFKPSFCQFKPLEWQKHSQNPMLVISSVVLAALVQ